MKKKGKRFIAVIAALSIVSGAGNYTGLLPDGTGIKAGAAQAKDKEYKVKNGMLVSYNGSSDVYIRKNVSAVSYLAFEDKDITSFSVDSGNKYLKAVDGVLYTRNGKRLVRYPSAKKGSFTVPDTVTYIAEDAFTGCKKLTSVDIPSSVKGIGKRAFYICKNLESVKLPAGLEKIADSTFCHCRSLKDINLPEGLEKIGEEAFSWCTSLEDIELPASLREIGYIAFNACKSLKNAKLPAGLEKIGGYAFNGCDRLESAKLPGNIEEMGPGIFAGCISLKSASVPGDISYIPNSFFSMCTNLMEVKLGSGISRIDGLVFSGCTNLASIKIPASVKEIGFNTFDGCSSLKNIILPKGIETLESGLFKNCTSLEKINIPARAKVIYENTFSNTATYFTVDSGNKYFSAKDGVLYNKTKTRLVKFPCYKEGNYTTPDSVTEISSYAFESCKKLGNVNISEGIKTFPKSCINNSSVKKLSLPESLSKIDTAYITIKAGNLEKITIPESNEDFCSDDGLLYSKDKTVLYIYPGGKMGKVTFAKEAEDLMAVGYLNKASSFNVEKGSDNYSSDDGMLTDKKERKILFVPGAKSSYTMGNNIKDISGLIRAKAYMKNFKSYETAPDNKKYTAKDGILYSRDGKELIDYPAYKTGSYKIPLIVTKVSSGALSYTHNLKKLTVTKYVSKFNVFIKNCGKLKEITVKEGDLRKFGINVSGNTRLEKLRLPSSLVSAYINGSKKCYRDAVVYGWTNTTSEKLAGKLGLKFKSKGIVPLPLKGVKTRAYVHGRRVRISWKMDADASGYEIYTDKERLRNIKDNRVTCADIYVGSNAYNVLYIRAYKVQGKKKTYGKARKIIYTNY